MKNLKRKLRNFFKTTALNSVLLWHRPGRVSGQGNGFLERCYRNKQLLQFLGKSWPILAILIITTIFFYPVWLQGKDPLPTDALVGAHVPWIEVKWEEYPAGVPIKNQEITDSISQFYPWRSLVGKFWRAGKFALWNPHMFSGTPFLATLHSSALYPLNVFYLVMNDIDAWTFLIVSQILLAGVFMYLFLKELGIKKMAALLGGIVFALSGYMIAWLEFATGGHAGLWLPLLLLFELKLVKSDRNLWLIPISLVFFFIFTAGDFQVPLYVCFTYVFFGGYLLVKNKKKKTLTKKQSIKVFLGLVLGILISLPQLLPTLELFRNSVRADDVYIKEYFYGLMHWKKIVNFIWPDFFGNVVTRNYWAEFGYHEYLGFVGVITLVFVAYSLLSKKAKNEAFFWLLLATSLLFLFPTPIAFMPFKLKIPALSTSSASRIIFLVDFCLAVLGAYGFSKWIEKKDLKIVKVLFGFLVITAGVGLGLFMSLQLIKQGNPSFDLKMASNIKVALRNMIPGTLTLLVLAGFVILWPKLARIRKFKVQAVRYAFLLPLGVVVMASAEMLRFGWKNTPFSPRKFLFPTTKIIEFLQKENEPFRIIGPGIPLNYFMQYEISSAEGYDPIYPLRNGEWYSAITFGNIDFPSRRYGQVHNISSELINYANVKYVIDYKKNLYAEVSDRGDFLPGIASKRYEPVLFEGRVGVFKNHNYLPKVWMSKNYKVISEPSNIIKELNTKEAVNEKLIVIENYPKNFQEIGSSESLKYSVNNFIQSFNEISFEINSTSDSLLFLSESYYPGWRAYVDGKEANIFRANYLFQSIKIPKGKHFVHFIYRPKSFKIGRSISLVTVIIMASMLVYEQFIKKGIGISQKRSS